MVIRGKVRDGRIVVGKRVRLPEGAKVEITLLQNGTHTKSKKVPTILERLRPIVGKAKGLPRDASKNLDHYLYGHPKKP